MENLLHVSPSPHIHAKRNTQGIMLDVIIALIPALIAGIILFGLPALTVVAVCIVFSIGSEYIFNLLLKREQTIFDLSAVVTGLLLGLNLPANIPLWQAAIGSVFAIIVVKCLFGGIGKNLFNPAIAARVFMLVAFGNMAKAAYPTIVDASSGATPLVLISENKAVDLLDLFLGKRGGAIGETCVLALLIGFVYLLIRKVITWQIPVSFIGSVFLLSLAIEGFDFNAALSWTMSGGLFIGAIFMATDYTTSPSSRFGKLLYGLIAGVITVLIRFFGSYPEGVSFAILLANILDPYIDLWTTRKLFGGNKR
ncbi:MAG: RnfABCDGE type electron transport complex subunit D [Ruminococcaceae bacterium]|nr:RnfABCDGE type electron transport complex subunit D [Oscillospiraceae bacterium]